MKPLDGFGLRALRSWLRGPGGAYLTDDKGARAVGRTYVRVQSYCRPCRGAAPKKGAAWERYEAARRAKAPKAK